MDATTLKSDLFLMIEALNAQQLNEVYGLFYDYLNGKEDTDSWGRLSLMDQEKIVRGIGQADSGLLKPGSEITERLRKKYGMNA